MAGYVPLPRAVPARASSVMLLLAAPKEPLETVRDAEAAVIAPSTTQQQSLRHSRQPWSC